MTAAEFAFALTDPDTAPPQGLVDPEGRAAGARFDVYRNNVVVGLTEALATGFPAIRGLVGAAFFTAMAGTFVRAHPPTSPVLTRYGTDFPTFLEDFAPVAHLPYLADVARLELALRAAYHAADTRPVDPARLETPELEQAKLTLAPALGLVRAPYPVHAIWRAGVDPTAPKARGGAQDVLITRPDFDPVATPIPPAAAHFVESLMQGARLGAAMERAGDDLDLAAILTLLLQGGAITGLEI